MKVLIVLSAILVCALARPSLIYTKLVSEAPIGKDGRVVDTAEVSKAKAEHAAAHEKEKNNLAQEAAKSADVFTYVAPANVAMISKAELVEPVMKLIAVATKPVAEAPIGPDGRVVDTPEVALAKEKHAMAHMNEKLGHEAAKSDDHEPLVILHHSAPPAHFLY